MKYWRIYHEYQTLRSFNWITIRVDQNCARNPPEIQVLILKQAPLHKETLSAILPETSVRDTIVTRAQVILFSSGDTSISLIYSVMLRNVMSVIADGCLWFHWCLWHVLSSVCVHLRWRRDWLVVVMCILEAFWYGDFGYISKDLVPVWQYDINHRAIHRERPQDTIHLLGKQVLAANRADVCHLCTVIAHF